MISQILALLLIVLGIFFTLTTAIGMVRFKDMFFKFHISSKCLTAGVISLLGGVLIIEGPREYWGKIVLLIVFLTLSNPIASHALGRAAYKNKHRPQDLVRDDYKGRRGNA